MIHPVIHILNAHLMSAGSWCRARLFSRTSKTLMQIYEANPTTSESPNPVLMGSAYASATPHVHRVQGV